MEWGSPYSPPHPPQEGQPSTSGMRGRACQAPPERDHLQASWRARAGQLPLPVAPPAQRLGQECSLSYSEEKSALKAETYAV